MGAWKDDNAIFFKFDHINEPAGFFGRGILGEGPYKFSVTPYYLIYRIFGNSSFMPYYVAIFIFYYLSTLGVYFLFTKLYSSFLGRISAFLFACGYVASEGYFWLSNAMFSNLAIISLALVLGFYYTHLTKKKIYFYLLSIFFFWLSINYYPLRTYSFAIVVAIFVLIFGFISVNLKQVISTLLRLIPFVLTYYFFFLKEVDSRAMLVKDFVLRISHGEFSKLSSFFWAVANLFIPNKYIDFVWDLGLVRSSKESLILVFGIIIFCFLLVFYFAVKSKVRKLYLFCCLWLFASIAVFSIYDPTAFFETKHRYLVNAIFPLVGILGIVFITFCQRKNLLGKIVVTLVILWGVGNIYNSYSLQSKINRDRSVPVANFYKQLKEYLPEIHKGDVLYFDVNRDALNYFTSAFSVSSMPETTAIAWRYGVDRYDLEMYTDFDELASNLEKDRKKIDGLYTFYYDKNGLTQTTAKTRNLLITGSTEIEKKDIRRIYPLTPILLTFKAQVVPDTNKILALYANKDQSVENKTDINYKKRLMAYLSEREKYYKSVKVKSLSEWKYQEIGNIIDDNMETSWRGHRIWWHDNSHEQLIIDLGKIENINRLVWVNWQHPLTPTSYSIAVSQDGYSWKKVIDRDSGPGRKDGETIIENFEPSYARFVKFDITDVLAKDSPAIREVEVVKSGFSDVDIGDAFAFRQKPLEGVQDLNGAKEIISFAAPFFKFNINWKTNKGEFSAQLPLRDSYNQFYTYSLILAPGGTNLYDINVNISDAPLSVTIESLSLKNLNLFDIQSFGLIKRFSQN